MRNKSNLSLLFLVFALCLTFVAFGFAQEDVSGKSDVQSPQVAESLFVEDFNYGNGSLLTAASGWTSHSGGGTNAIAVTSSGLTYSGYASSGVGNAVSLTTSGEDDNKLLASPISTGTVYAAAMINVSASQTTGDYFFHLFVNSSTFYGKVFAKKDSASSNYAIGISKNANAATATFTGFTFAPGSTHLVIVKYTFNSGSTTDDTVDLFIDPALGGAEPAVTLTAGDNATATDAVNIAGIAVRQGTAAAAPTAQVDGIRVSSTWPSLGTPATVVKHVADYDGDGKTDYGVVRGGGSQSSPQTWYIKVNGSPTEIQRVWGFASDILAPADYDGDGKTDIAVWRQNPAPSTFYVLRSSDSTFQVTRFGGSGDIPISADYTGDGKADPAVFHIAGAVAQFWYSPSSGPFLGQPVAVPFGSSSDIPDVGDFNGDGKADFCFVHSANGLDAFNIRYGTDSVNPGPPDTLTYFGIPSDAVVSGDYDGDGKADIAVTRNEGGNLIWYYNPSSTGGPFQRIAWGLGTDLQVPGDYDGDGKTDAAVWRPSSTGVFYVLGSSGGFLFQQYGIGTTDTPVNFDVLQ